MGHGVEGGAVDVLDGDADLGCGGEHVFDLFGVATVGDEDDFEAALACTERGFDGLTAFQVLHFGGGV